jgi:hypothetical protein
MSVVLKTRRTPPTAALTRERVPDAGAKVRRTGGLYVGPFRVAPIEVVAALVVVGHACPGIDPDDDRSRFVFAPSWAVTADCERYRQGALRLDLQAVAALIEQLREQRAAVPRERA